MKYTLVDCWPMLAWCAVCKHGTTDIRVLHGSKVETSQRWFGEIVWAGEYSDADFDETDIVAGSGGRYRQDKIVFVSSGSIVDRLHVLRCNNRAFVSNSLPCLLSIVEATLDPTYPKYYEDLRSINGGIDDYHRMFDSSKGPVEFIYFDNLIWDGNDLSLCAKAESEMSILTFDDYNEFLTSSMRSMARNINAPDRQYSYEMLASVSSGYDSPAVATIAKAGGCTRALTIDRSRAGDSDSGEEIARYLGLDIHIADRNGWRNEKCAEVPFIAGGPGGGGSVYFKSAEEQLGGTVFFSGLGGGLMWGKPHRDKYGKSVAIGFSDASLTEYRLDVGFIHCALPLWGMRDPDQLFKITESTEMIPWCVPGNYNRPIARRIVESAGVPRTSFGMTKKAAAFKLHQPFSPGESLSASSVADFNLWLRESRTEWFRQWKIPPTYAISVLVDVLMIVLLYSLRLIMRLMPISSVRSSLWLKTRALGHLARRPPGSVRLYTFPWAINRMQDKYDTGRKCYEQDA